MQTYPPGTRIGQYEIASLPMMGGMGVVYFALDHGNDGRPVALKTFRPELLPDRAARDRFLREGTAWIELGSHPHIVRCYSVEYHDPTVFLVLELISKEKNLSDASLRSWLIPGRPLPLEQALLFALQIARGMQHATEKLSGFVHRDLKPENILVGADRLPGTNINRLRVTDFGLAKTITYSGVSAITSNIAELKPNQIQITRGVGTPLYMAPEQWKGEPVGVFTDVYSFGCILYEMLTGKQVVAGNSVDILKQVHCADKDLSLLDKYPIKVKQIVECCLDTISTNRYENWVSLEDILIIAWRKLTDQEIPTNATLESKETNSNEALGWTYNAIGRSYRDIGNVTKALSYFSKTRTLGRDLENSDLEFSGLLHTGTALSILGKHIEAMEYLERALKIAQESGDFIGEGLVLGNLGDVYFRLGDLNKAIEITNRRKDMAEKADDLRGEISALQNLSNIYREMGKVHDSIECSSRALLLSRSMNDLRSQGNCLGNLGTCYAFLGDNSRSLEYYEEQLTVTRSIGDRLGESNALGNIGGLFLNIDKHDQAIVYIGQAVSIDREIGNLTGESQSLTNLGAIYRDLKDYQRAIDYFEQALSIANNIEDNLGSGRISLHLAETCLMLNGDNEAFVYSQNAIRHFSRVNYVRGVINAIKLNAKIFAKGDPEDPSNLTSALIFSVMFVDSLATMRSLLLAFPILADENIIHLVETVMAQKSSPEQKITFDERLTWLKQIVGK